MSLQQFSELDSPLWKQVPLTLLGGLCIVLFTLGVASVIKGEAKEPKVAALNIATVFFQSVFL